MTTLSLTTTAVFVTIAAIQALVVKSEYDAGWLDD